MPEHGSAIAADLGAGLAGAVLTPNHPGYLDAVMTYNGAVRHRPLVVVRPGGFSDLTRVLAYAGRHGLRVTARGGGHGSNGYALNSRGIVVDMRALAGVRLEGDEIVVGAGATWNDVYDCLQHHDPAAFAVGATWPSVGVAGFVMGGGYSFLSRSRGLACDNLIACRFAAACGAELEAREDSADSAARDLFWALKGGGGGNFGLASELRLRRHRAARQLLTGVVTFPFAHIEEVLGLYDGWASTLPCEMSVYGAILAAPDPADPGPPELVLRLSFAFDGARSEGMELLLPLLDLGPREVRLYEMGLAQWARYLGSDDSGGRFGAYTRSAMLRSGDLVAAVPVLRRYVEAVPKEAVFVVWTHGGGAIARVPRSSAAFPHRETDFIFAVRVFWPVERPEAMRGLVSWGYRFFEDLKPFGRGAYVNYIDPLLADWADAYYGDAYPRLLKMRETLDPEGVLRFQQGIGSDFRPGPPSCEGPPLAPLFRTFHD